MLGLDEKTNYAPLAQNYAAHRKPYPEVLSRLTAALNERSRVLELGCGTGNYILTIRQQLGCDCVGIDPSKEMLAQLAARDASLTTQLGPAERLELADQSFDLVYSVDVIHHIRDCQAAFAEAARTLKPGARLCTATDSEWIIRNRPVLSKYFPETIAVELARYPRIDALKHEMQAAGFEAISDEMVEHSYQLVDATPFREKVFSSLLYLSDQAFARGLAQLEADLARGPVTSVVRYTLVWGSRPA